ncbi:MAG: hypothetical protein DI551_00735 [Micavibrio aeruginosavorus]|uniref:Uncharacterized protein n=1 Tax=Micavibrio aeruginosavorus TaxID=349221 RepID=A0A2W5N9D2_9BACT|nr:MAG: hypothetical protein DI551_00735 [Micavibrio aeruginosavorus]
MTTDTQNQQNPNPADPDKNPADPANPPPSAYRPEGMPDHYAGKTDNETIDNLYKAVDGYRKQQSKDRGIPENINDYKTDLPDDVASILIRPGEDGKDPIWEHMRGIAHKRGISSEDFVELAKEWGMQMHQAAQAQATGEGMPDFDFKELGGAEKAQATIDGANAFLMGLKNTQKLSDKAFEELSLLSLHSQGLKALGELQAAMGVKPIPAKIEGQEPAAGEKTQEQLNEMMRDERYWKTKDPAFIREVTEGFQKLYNKAA